MIDPDSISSEQRASCGCYRRAGGSRISCAVHADWTTTLEVSPLGPGIFEARINAERMIGPDPRDREARMVSGGQRQESPVGRSLTASAATPGPDQSALPEPAHPWRYLDCDLCGEPIGYIAGKGIKYEGTMVCARCYRRDQEREPVRAGEP